MCICSRCLKIMNPGTCIFCLTPYLQCGVCPRCFHYASEMGYTPPRKNFCMEAFAPLVIKCPICEVESKRLTMTAPCPNCYYVPHFVQTGPRYITRSMMVRMKEEEDQKKEIAMMREAYHKRMPKEMKRIVQVDEDGNVETKVYEELKDGEASKTFQDPLKRLRQFFFS